MRITQNTLFNGLRQQLQTNATSLLRAQEQVATQKKLNRLSDNPVDGGRVLDLNSAIARSAQYVANIERGTSMAGIQDETLDQVYTLLTRAKELTLKENNEVTSTSATREATRVEIAMLTSQLVQLGNTRYDGQYIFSGYATGTPAFSDAAVSVAPAAIAGRGAVTSQTVADVSKMTYHNYQINFTAAGQFDVVDTTSGATIAANQAYTSGGPIRFDGIEIVIADQPGAPQVGDSYAITTAPPGVYQGDGQTQEIEVQPNTRVALNLAGDQVFSGSSGGVDLFALMNTINTALRANDQATLETSLNQLDQAATQISSIRSNVGARVNLLENVQQRQSDVQTSLEILKSNLEDIDVAEALTQLTKQQNVYEATLGAAARIVQPSLLDFLG